MLELKEGWGKRITRRRCKENIVCKVEKEGRRRRRNMKIRGRKDKETGRNGDWGKRGEG